MGVAVAPQPDVDDVHRLEELKLLFDSGVQSPDALRRSRELMDARTRLKT